MKKVLIFGIGGFVGAYLVNELQNHGYKIYGSDLREKMIDNIPVAAANLLNPEAVEDIIRKIMPDIVINLAAISSVGQSWDTPQMTVQVNVIGALNILEATRKQSHKPKVMFIGSSEEYMVGDKPINETALLNANNPYGISKITQERFAELYRKQYGLQIYCVRSFNHTGLGQRDNFVLPSFCKQVAEIEKSGRSGIIKVGNLSVKRDFSHVKDVVRAYRMILENGDETQIYNVGSGVAYSLSELLDYIISLSHQKILVEVDGARIRLVDTPVICCDNNKIQKELGWKPEYTVFDALDELYKSYL